MEEWKNGGLRSPRSRGINNDFRWTRALSQPNEAAIALHGAEGSDALQAKIDCRDSLLLAAAVLGQSFPSQSPVAGLPERGVECPNHGVYQEHQRAKWLHRHGIRSLFESEECVENESNQQHCVG